MDYNKHGLQKFVIAVFALSLFANFACSAQDSARPVRMAIVCDSRDAGTMEISAKLFSGCSRYDNIILLERDELKKIISEKELNLLFSGDQSNGRVASGKYDFADLFLIIKPFEDGRKGYFITLVETRTGVVIDQFISDAGAVSEPATLKRISVAAMKAGLPIEKRINIGIVGINSSEPGNYLKQLSRGLEHLIKTELTGYGDIVVLDRRNLLMLRQEEIIAGEMLKLRTSTVLLKGNIRRSSADAASVDVYFEFSTIDGRKTGEKILTVKGMDPVLISTKAAAAISSFLNKNEKSEAQEPITVSLEKESERFKKECEYFSHNRMREEAAAAAEAAYSLAPGEENLKFLLDELFRLAEWNEEMEPFCKAALEYYELDMERLGRSADEERWRDYPHCNVNRKQMDISNPAYLEVLKMAKKKFLFLHDRNLAKVGRDGIIYGLVSNYKEATSFLKSAVKAGIFPANFASRLCSDFYRRFKTVYPCDRMDDTDKEFTVKYSLIYALSESLRTGLIQAQDPLFEKMKADPDYSFKATGIYLSEVHLNQDSAIKKAGGEAIIKLYAYGKDDADKFSNGKVRIVKTSGYSSYHCLQNSGFSFDECFYAMSNNMDKKIFYDKMREYFDAYIVSADLWRMEKLYPFTEQFINMAENDDERYERCRRINEIFEKENPEGYYYLRQIVSHRVKEYEKEKKIKPLDWGKFKIEPLAQFKDDKEYRGLIHNSWHSYLFLSGKYYYCAMSLEKYRKTDWLRGTSIIRIDLENKTSEEVFRQYDVHIPFWRDIRAAAINDSTIYLSDNSGLYSISKNTVDKYVEQDGLYSNMISSLCWMNGKLYIGYWHGALGTYCPESGKFELIASSRSVGGKTPLDNCKEYTIKSMVADKSGAVLWLYVNGYPRSGIWKYDSPAGTVSFAGNGGFECHAGSEGAFYMDEDTLVVDNGDQLLNYDLSSGKYSIVATKGMTNDRNTFSGFNWPAYQMGEYLFDNHYVHSKNGDRYENKIFPLCKYRDSILCMDRKTGSISLLRHEKRVGR